MPQVSVLLLEDNPSDARLVLEALRDFGSHRTDFPKFSLTSAATLAEAVAHFDNHTIDVAVVDLSLPDSTGVQTFRTLRARAPDVPIVVLTGSLDEQVAPEVLREGAQDYLSKDNVSSELLRRALHYALERKRFEEVRARQLADEEAMKARDEFLAAAAHDLRNPLATIKGTAQLLQRTMSKGEAVTPERLSHSLGTLVSSVNHAISQVTELLDVARVRLGSPLTLDFHPTDMAALCRESVETFQQATERHQLRLTIASQDAQRFKGSWDGHRLRRVVDNLLSNAIKFSPQGGTIAVDLDCLEDAEHAGYGEHAEHEEPRQAWIRLSVRDSGVGIPSTDLPCVFERFRRGANAAAIDGSGVGLAAARHIVEQHGGTIELTSTEGHGTTVILRVPVTLSSPA